MKKTYQGAGTSLIEGRGRADDGFEGPDGGRSKGVEEATGRGRKADGTGSLTLDNFWCLSLYHFILSMYLNLF